MCDLLDCRNCKHKCKNDLNDNEIEDLWREWEDVAFIESEDKNWFLLVIGRAGVKELVMKKFAIVKGRIINEYYI